MVGINVRPEVRGVAVVTRNGKVVGKVPLASPLPSKVAKKSADGDAEKSSEQSSALVREDDPF